MQDNTCDCLMDGPDQCPHMSEENYEGCVIIVHVIGIVPPSSVRKEIGNLISWISSRFGLIFDISFSVLDLILCVYLKLFFLIFLNCFVLLILKINF